MGWVRGVGISEIEPEGAGWDEDAGDLTQRWEKGVNPVVDVGFESELAFVLIVTKPEVGRRGERHIDTGVRDGGEFSSRVSDKYRAGQWGRLPRWRRARMGEQRCCWGLGHGVPPFMMRVGSSAGVVMMKSSSGSCGLREIALASASWRRVAISGVRALIVQMT